MMGLAILLGGAALGFGLARWLGLPSIPFLLLTGFLLATAGFLPEQDVLENVLVLGVSFLLFVAGTELNPGRVKQYRGVALRVGFVQFFTLTVVGFCAAYVLGYTLLTSLYLALALAASSTLVVVRLLQQRRQMFEPFGRMVIGVLLLQDLLIIVLMPVATRLPAGWLSVATGLAFTLVLIALAYIVARWVAPYILIEWELDEESLLLSILAILFIFIGLAYVFDLPLITGAFLAGVSLSGFPVSGLVREQLHSLSDFFLSLFFTALGGLIVIPTAGTLLSVLVFVLVVVLLTPPLVTLVAERAGFSARAAIESGLLLAQTSEFSLIIGLQALLLGYIEQQIFSVFVLVTVITMVLTPFIATNRITWKLIRWHPSSLPDRTGEPPRDHILLLGCGDSGMPLLETLLLAGYDMFVIDDDPIVIEQLQQNNVPCLRGDGSDLKVLASAGAHQARAILSLIRRPRDNRALLQYVDNVPVLVRVFAEEDAEFIEALGGMPIRYAEAAAEAFLHWYEASSVPKREAVKIDDGQ